MKNLIIFTLLVISFTAKSQGLQLGNRIHNQGYLLYNGQFLTASRDQLAKIVHIYLPQPKEPRLMILQDTQAGTVSIFAQENTGKWRLITSNTTRLIPTITWVSGKFRISWNGFPDVNIALN